MHETIGGSVDPTGRATSILTADDDSMTELHGSGRGPGRRAIAIALVATIASAVAVVALQGGGSGHEPETLTPATTVPVESPAEPADHVAATAPPTSAAPTTTPPPTTPAPTTPPAPAVAADPEPEPILADGRHPVYLTDVDVSGGTVEIDLLQYLTGDAAEAYEAAHPDEYAGDDYDESPFHNDNPRLRRLPVASDARVVVQGSTAEICDETRTIAFGDLPSYFGGERYEGHLGYKVFWLDVDADRVVGLEELQCAG